MKSARLTLAATAATALICGAHAQTGTEGTPSAATALASESRYLQHIGSRFASFAGSDENLESLALGLRHGAPVTLNGSAEVARFTPPTRPMGYGNVTRALELASRQLAAAGITEPTPQEIQAAMMGGTVSGPEGNVMLPGVLALRSEGMGWGKIALTIGVHPGLGSGKPAAAQPGSRPAPATHRQSTSVAGGAGITTALGASAHVHASGTASIVRGSGHGAQHATQQDIRGNGKASGHAGGKR